MAQNDGEIPTEEVLVESLRRSLLSLEQDIVHRAPSLEESLPRQHLLQSARNRIRNEQQQIDIALEHPFLAQSVELIELSKRMQKLLARVLFALEEWREALDGYVRVLQSDPNDRMALYFSARCALHLSELDTFLAMKNMLERLDPCLSSILPSISDQEYSCYLYRSASILHILEREPVDHIYLSSNMSLLDIFQLLSSVSHRSFICVNWKKLDGRDLPRSLQSENSVLDEQDICSVSSSSSSSSSISSKQNAGKSNSSYISRKQRNSGQEASQRTLRSTVRTENDCSQTESTDCMSAMLEGIRSELFPTKDERVSEMISISSLDNLVFSDADESHNIKPLYSTTSRVEILSREFERIFSSTNSGIVLSYEETVIYLLSRLFSFPLFEHDSLLVAGKWIRKCLSVLSFERIFSPHSIFQNSCWQPHVLSLLLCNEVLTVSEQHPTFTNSLCTFCFTPVKFSRGKGNLKSGSSKEQEKLLSRGDLTSLIQSNAYMMKICEYFLKFFEFHRNEWEPFIDSISSSFLQSDDSSTASLTEFFQIFLNLFVSSRMLNDLILDRFDNAWNRALSTESRKFLDLALRVYNLIPVPRGKKHHEPIFSSISPIGLCEYISESTVLKLYSSFSLEQPVQDCSMFFNLWKSLQYQVLLDTLKPILDVPINEIDRFFELVPYERSSYEEFVFLYEAAFSLEQWDVAVRALLCLFRSSISITESELYASRNSERVAVDMEGFFGGSESRGLSGFSFSFIGFKDFSQCWIDQAIALLNQCDSCSLSQKWDESLKAYLLHSVEALLEYLSIKQLWKDCWLYVCESACEFLCLYASSEAIVSDVSSIFFDIFWKSGYKSLTCSGMLFKPAFNFGLRCFDFFWERLKHSSDFLARDENYEDTSIFSWSSEEEEGKDYQSFKFWTFFLFGMNIDILDTDDCVNIKEASRPNGVEIHGSSLGASSSQSLSQQMRNRTASNEKPSLLSGMDALLRIYTFVQQHQILFHSSNITSLVRKELEGLNHRLMRCITCVERIDRSIRHHVVECLMEAMFVHCSPSDNGFVVWCYSNFKSLDPEEFVLLIETIASLSILIIDDPCLYTLDIPGTLYYSFSENKEEPRDQQKIEEFFSSFSHSDCHSTKSEKLIPKLLPSWPNLSLGSLPRECEDSCVHRRSVWLLSMLLVDSYLGSLAGQENRVTPEQADLVIHLSWVLIQFDLAFAEAWFQIGWYFQSLITLSSVYPTTYPSLLRSMFSKSNPYMSALANFYGVSSLVVSDWASDLGSDRDAAAEMELFSNQINFLVQGSLLCISTSIALTPNDVDRLLCMISFFEDIQLLYMSQNLEWVSIDVFLAHQFSLERVEALYREDASQSTDLVVERNPCSKEYWMHSDRADEMWIEYLQNFVSLKAASYLISVHPEYSEDVNLSSRESFPSLYASLLELLGICYHEGELDKADSFPHFLRQTLLRLSQCLRVEIQRQLSLHPDVLFRFIDTRSSFQQVTSSSLIVFSVKEKTDSRRSYKGSKSYILFARELFEELGILKSVSSDFVNNLNQEVSIQLPSSLSDIDTDEWTYFVGLLDIFAEVQLFSLSHDPFDGASFFEISDLLNVFGEMVCSSEANNHSSSVGFLSTSFAFVSGIVREKSGGFEWNIWRKSNSELFPHNSLCFALCGLYLNSLKRCLWGPLANFSSNIGLQSCSSLIRFSRFLKDVHFLDSSLDIFDRVCEIYVLSFEFLRNLPDSKYFEEYSAGLADSLRSIFKSSQFSIKHGYYRRILPQSALTDEHEHQRLSIDGDAEERVQPSELDSFLRELSRSLVKRSSSTLSQESTPHEHDDVEAKRRILDLSDMESSQSETQSPVMSIFDEENDSNTVASRESNKAEGGETREGRHDETSE